MSSAVLMSLLAAISLALLHVAAPHLHGEALERPRWFAAAAGMSVAYVLVQLLPELAESQTEWLQQLPNRPLRWLDRQVYVAALVGMILALGANYLALAREKPQVRFWIDTGWAALHSVVVGAVGLHVNDLAGLLLALVAFGSHFLLNDHSMLLHHRRSFTRYGRWVLAAALMLGWAKTANTQPHIVVVATLLGLLSGSILLTVIKEELPEKRLERFPMFVLGSVVYAVLLLAMNYIDH